MLLISVKNVCFNMVKTTKVDVGVTGWHSMYWKHLLKACFQRGFSISSVCKGVNSLPF